MAAGFLTVQQAADLLRMDRARIQTAAREGRLAAIREGQTWQVLLDGSGRLVYRADRVQPQWQHEQVLVIGALSMPWPEEIASRISTAASESESPALQRERELLGLLDKERNDREFDRMAAESRVEDAALEVARLRAQLEDERRRRELGMRDYLLTMRDNLAAMASMIPPAEPAERERLGIPEP